MFDAKDQRLRDRYGTVHGKDGFTLFAAGKGKSDEASGGGGGGGWSGGGGTFSGGGASGGW